MPTPPIPQKPFPLSKILHPDDLTGPLLPAVECLNRYQALEGQHPLRAWEYGMALTAIQEWSTTQNAGNDPLRICDVGGAGSRFHHALVAVTAEDVIVLDPDLPELTDDQRSPRAIYHKRTVEEQAAIGPHGMVDVLTCISVIEHVPNLPPFFRACAMLLKPGGLLFLTTDCWDCEGEDQAHFHWMRQRIYNPGRLKKQMERLRELGFRSFGPGDWQYHGNQVYDYSFGSICMVKKG